MGGTSVEGLVVPKPGGISIPGGGAISPASTSFSNTFRGLCKSIKEPWHKKLNEMQQRMFCYDVIPMFLQTDRIEIDTPCLSIDRDLHLP